jgi:hypothetical protein
VKYTTTSNVGFLSRDNPGGVMTKLPKNLQEFREDLGQEWSIPKIILSQIIYHDD